MGYALSYVTILDAKAIAGVSNTETNWIRCGSTVIKTLGLIATGTTPQIKVEYRTRTGANGQVTPYVQLLADHAADGAWSSATTYGEKEITPRAGKEYQFKLSNLAAGAATVTAKVGRQTTVHA